ncbi:MAG TPA: type I methionyl aminopeptidase [Nocardioidaceae bacterium]|nr:type I methionyl aminopeptidase [Nocardioidaceae bacterium]
MSEATTAVFGRDRIQYKTHEQILAMRRAGLVVVDALDAVREAVKPGVTTAQLDEVAERTIRAAGAIPSFKGYYGFPASLCVSVNSEVVHGIPGKAVISEGDLVSIDCGAILDGWHGDSAFSMVVPGGDSVRAVEDQALIDTTEAAMWSGIAALEVGGRLGDVGAAIEDRVDGRYGILEDYVGHGIGTEMHMAPEVLNYRTRDRGPKVRAGLCVAVEPMLVAGSIETTVLDDDWTVVTNDGKRAAHWEHTVAVTEEGVWVLTARDGGEAALTALGAAVGPLA